MLASSLASSISKFVAAMKSKSKCVTHPLAFFYQEWSFHSIKGVCKNKFPAQILKSQTVNISTDHRDEEITKNFTCENNWLYM